MIQTHHVKDPTPITGDGPVYLIVADETDEFSNALRYAARSARANHGQVAVLYVMGAEEGFSHWSTVEERVRAEQKLVAEKFLFDVAEQIRALSGPEPVLFTGEGDRAEAILALLDANPKITKLILGGNSAKLNPGPLVKYFSGKGLKRLPVPLTVIADHITAEKIDQLV